MTQGYNEADRAVTITSDTPSDEDFALTIGESCTAPGYQLRGLNVGFDFGIPGDWTVSDEKGTGVVWMTNADSGRSNYTGGSGLAATADSDFAGYAAYDTSLITPSITVADLANTQLNYRAMHYQYSGLDFLDLDISVDGGTWTNISHWLENHYPGQLISVDLASYLTGAKAFKLRWRYSTTQSGTPWDYFAQVDDVHLGSACIAKAGGLVLGKVIDDNTDLAINGALVDGAGSTTTFATPDDDGLDDGFYQLFVAAGKRTLVAHASNYTSASVVVDVESDAIVMADDLVLTAGKLDMPATIDVTLAKGKSTTSTLTIENVGSADATYSLFEINAPVLVIAPDEKLDPSVRRVGPKDKERMAAKLRVYTPPQVPTLSGGTVVDSWATDLAYPWGISVNRDANDLWVGNIAAGGGDDLNYQFTARGVMTESTIDTSSWVTNFAADMTYDDRNGTLWQVNVGGDNCIYEMNPTTKLATGNSICPEFAVSQRGLAYDPISDTFFAGSWNDLNVVRFKRDGTILSRRNVGLAIAGLSYNPSNGHLLASVNSDQITDVYVIDVNNDYEVVGGFNVEGMGDNQQAGAEMDCAGNLYVVNQATQRVLKVETGETGVCGWKDIQWLSSSAPVALEAGDSADVALTVNAAALQPGTYNVQLIVRNDTPYGSNNVPVNLTVNVPVPGTITLDTEAVTVKEDVGNVTVTLTRSGGTDGEISASVATLVGSANTSDFVAGAQTVTWADGETGDKTVSIAITNDDKEEGAESFSVILSEVSGGASRGNNDALTITIKSSDKEDDDGLFGGSTELWGVLMLALMALRRRFALN